jgi:hypothetical protein
MGKSATALQVQPQEQSTRIDFVLCSRTVEGHTMYVEGFANRHQGDDLSMFLAVGALLHQLLCFEATPAQRRNYTLAILGVLIPVSTYHVVANEIYVHEIVFGIMVIMVVSKTRKLIRERVKNEEHKKRMGQLASFGVGKWNRMKRAASLS